jgi:outer membrane protein assembly factor BamB
MKKRVLAALLALCALAAGCSLFEKKKEPLPGVRISVLGLDRQLEPDPQLAATPITLPPAVANPDWPQAGGEPDHAMHRLALPAALRQVWTVSVGKGSTNYAHVTAPPVVGGGRVFTLDGAAQVSAVDAGTGKLVWQVDLKPKGAPDGGFGGGVALWAGRLYAATGYGDVMALDPHSGKVLWRHSVGTPIHAPPTVADGRIYVVSVENELSVLSTEDGHKIWSHNGLPQTADLLGGASPAVAGEVVLVPYTSGELFALTAATGRPLWQENLAQTRTADAVSALADIRGRPVIDGDRVFAVGHSGLTEAIDPRSDNRVWEQEIGGTQSPWPVGGFVYLVTNEGELVCLARDTGKVRWLHQLPRWGNEKKKEDPIFWVGPVLGGNRLIVASSHGELQEISPEDGKPVGPPLRLPAPAFVAPVIAGGTLYILTDDATLAAYR